jgi:hypothetical protein
VEIRTVTKTVDDDDPRLDGPLPLGYKFDHIANILFCFYNEQYWLYAV